MKDIKQYIFVIKQLNRKETRRLNSGTQLGTFWNVFNPLLFMVVMSTLYGTIFKHDIDNFQVYFFSGFIIYTLYKSGMEGAMLSIVQNKNFLLHTKIPMRIFVFERVYTALVNSIYMLIAFVAVLIYYKIPFRALDILVIPVILSIVLTVFGFGEVLAVICVFFEDIRYLYSILMTLVMFGSAIIFPIERVSQGLQMFIRITPIYNGTYLFRSIVMNGKIPELTAWIEQMFWCAFALFIGEVVFKKNMNKLVEKI